MATGPWYTTWFPLNTVIWCGARSTWMWYGLTFICTSPARSQPVLPFGRIGNSTRTQPGRCSWTRNTSGTVGFDGSSSRFQVGPNVIFGCADDGSSNTPARGARTCAITLTPGGRVVVVGTGEDVLGEIGLVPAVRGDPPPPPHATASTAATPVARADLTIRARQVVITRTSRSRTGAPEAAPPGHLSFLVSALALTGRPGHTLNGDGRARSGALGRTGALRGT